MLGTIQQVTLVDGVLKLNQYCAPGPHNEHKLSASRHEQLEGIWNHKGNVTQFLDHIHVPKSHSGLLQSEGKISSSSLMHPDLMVT